VSDVDLRTVQQRLGHGHGIDEALFEALAKSAAARESKRDFRLGKSFVRLPMVSF
jgi:hypothetical protein